MSNEDKKYKLILVDDDEFLVNMYVTKFNLSGIEVEAFNSGDALVNKAKSGGISADAILLDIIMPKLSGVETLKILKEEKLIEGIPVIMLTNQSDEKDINECKSYGVAGYIVKSAATPSEVVNEVINIIKG